MVVGSGSGSNRSSQRALDHSSMEETFADVRLPGEAAETAEKKRRCKDLFEIIRKEEWVCVGVCVRVSCEKTEVRE